MIRWTFLICLSVAAFDAKIITRCLWHKNACVDVCPEWMLEQASDCTKTYWNAQRTCDHPEQHMLVGTVCGYSRCDCPDSTVLDTDTGYCYDVDNCPTKHGDVK